MVSLWSVDSSRSSAVQLLLTTKKKDKISTLEAAQLEDGCRKLVGSRKSQISNDKARFIDSFMQNSRPILGTIFTQRHPESGTSGSDKNTSLSVALRQHGTTQLLNINCGNTGSPVFILSIFIPARNQIHNCRSR